MIFHISIIIIIILNYFILTTFALINFSDIKCGQIGHRKPKIVGGQDAIKSEFPWIVSITRRGQHFCGGTLISKNYIMTAAHCICTGSGNDRIKSTAVKVTISQYDLTEEDSDAYEVPVRNIIVHPNYLCNKVKNDIAILELDKEIEWTENVTPACLPAENKEKTLISNLATVAGWGWTSEDRKQGAKATVLRKANVHVIEIEKCNNWYKSQGKKNKIQESQICAGHEQGGIDACWADSGGPLMIKTENQYQMMVVGVVSTGIGCARPFLPGIYTRVSEFVPWIKETVTNK